MMTVKEVAWEMMSASAKERQEAEKMIGKSFKEMTQQERLLAAECLAAFDGFWQSLGGGE